MTQPLERDDIPATILQRVERKNHGASPLAPSTSGGKCPVCDEKLNDGECGQSDFSRLNVAAELAEGVHRHIAHKTGGAFFRYGSIRHGYWCDLYNDGSVKVGQYGQGRELHEGISFDCLPFDFNPKDPQPLIDLINLLTAIS